MATRDEPRSEPEDHLCVLIVGGWRDQEVPFPQLVAVVRILVSKISDVVEGQRLAGNRTLTTLMHRSRRARVGQTLSRTLAGAAQRVTSL
jgi:hypothetical protein